jgi:hypothetical protein
MLNKVYSRVMSLEVTAVASSAVAETTTSESVIPLPKTIYECIVQADGWSNTQWQTKQFGEYGYCVTDERQGP